MMPTRHRDPTQCTVPRATYRVQLHADFRFSDAAALVPYLAALGISHLYCSPFLRARAGSRHGYDVVDHGQINPEIGSRADLEALVATLRAHGMGLLIDLVPNHMGVLGGDNAWWLDVLENGPASAFAAYFDIDWHSADPALTGRVLLPLLGDQYGLVLERGELQLQFAPDSGRYTLSYHEHRLPIDPAGYGTLLRRAAAALRPHALDADALATLATLIEDFERLPSRDSTDAAAITRRQRDKTLLKRRLAAQVAAQPALAQVIAAQVDELNGRVAARASFDALDALISAQPYRLAHWRTASDQINYRRFFDINELAALRMERPEVFEATHALVLRLAADGWVDGLRIDHPDGLADPAGYFRRLQLRYAELAGIALPDPPGEPLAARPLYVVIEKIVAPHEQVSTGWAVHGTTGYRFANVVNGLLIDGGAKARLDRSWRAFVGDEAVDFDALAWHGKHLVMDGALAGELTVLATALLRLAREDRRTRDFTLNSLRHALADVVAALPVYRTYLIDKPSAQDRRYIAWAIGLARRRSLGADASVFDFLHRVLLGKPLPGAPAGLGQRYNAFARRLQQYTSPVAAKGIEDTALYRHHRLISVNDVGGDPDAFGLSVAAFHAASRDRAQRWPHTMLATSTHDAKRSEDVRARIDVISEMPAAWRLTVRRWMRLNRSHKHTVNGAPAPSRNDEYLLYQTLVGSLPDATPDDAALAAYTARIDQAMLKSARESKAVTSWINPNAAYEAALSAFVQALLAPREGNLFLQDLRSTLPVFAWHGALNSCTLAALKCLSPGVPDFYQGHAAIELTLMDPDNRSPVDHPRRRSLLARAQASRALPDEAARCADLRALLQRAGDGELKFRVTWAALQLRRDHKALLRDGDYLPLHARGVCARHVVAFARRAGGRWVLVVATRLYASFGLPAGEAPIGAVWGDTVVELPTAGSADALAPGSRLHERLSGRDHATDAGALALADLLRDCPLALLETADAALR
jgi:(1->4)-alpha-D-glucan 1-alpha-D-glucosylmutase